MLFWVPDQNNALRFSGFQPEARLRATLGQDAPYGRGGSAPSPYAPPRQAGRPSPVGHCVEGFCGSIRLAPAQTDRRSRLPRVFSGLRPEARHTPRRPCGLPHGRGVSDPSPCAPPRQALCTDPFEHSVEGFCGAARVEWAGPVWAKNRSRRAVTCVSLPPSQRRAPFRGFHKGDTPLCALLVPFRASEKGPAARGRTPRIPCRRKAAFFLKR